MDDQSGWLVDHGNVVIFEHDVEGNWFRQEIVLNRRRNSDLDPLTGGDLESRAPHDTIYGDVARFDQLMKVRPAEVGQVARDELIEAIIPILDCRMEFNRCAVANIASVYALTR
jgi:hypothetical protein